MRQGNLRSVKGIKRGALEAVAVSARSSNHLEISSSRLSLQLLGVIQVTGKEEDLVIFREGSDGLDGGGAAGGVHVGESQRG